MKKAIVTSALLLCLLPSFSQIKKGMHTFGMNVSLYSNSNSYTESESEYTSGYLYPRAGILLSDKLELGIGLSYAFNKNSANYEGTTPASSEYKESVFGILPYLKYYIPVSERFYFDLNLIAGMGFGSRSESYSSVSFNDDGESDILQFSASLYPQFNYLFNEHWAVNFGLGSLTYQNTTYEDKETSEKRTSSTFNFYGSFASGLSLGAIYYF